MDEFNGFEVLFVEPLTDSQIGELAVQSTPLSKATGSVILEFKSAAKSHKVKEYQMTQLGNISVNDMFSHPNKEIQTNLAEKYIEYDIFSNY
jgi:hypothetical protein